MAVSNIASVASKVAHELISSTLAQPEFDDMPVEDLVEKACFMKETHEKFKAQGIDLDDASIQMEVLCEFQKAMADELIGNA